MFFLKDNREALFGKRVRIQDLIAPAGISGKRNQDVWLAQCQQFANGIGTCPGNNDVGSSEQLAEAMLEIIENPDFAKKLSENGRKLLKTHSIENISRQWLDYLSRI